MAKDKNEFQEYLEIFKHKQLWIFGLVIPLFLEFALIAKSSLGVEHINIIELIKKINVLSTGILYILSVVLLSIPKYCIERFRLITNEFNEQMKKIEKCPKMVALHTDNNALETKFNLIENAGDHKWLLSKLLSEMIAKKCENFSFRIPSTSEFIKFTSSLATIRVKEVKFYTLISAFTWLDSFTEKDDQTEDKKHNFYNNLEQEFPLNKALLDEYFNIITSNKISTKLYVFLSQFEWENKYLSERYLDAYYKIINKIDGIENKDIYFINNDKYDWSKCKETFDEEYVMYDDVILLSYNGDEHLLSYVSDEKFNSKKQILDKCTQNCLDYYQLKEKIIGQKISLLKKIMHNSDNTIPKISHTLSFLFRGNKFWLDYQKKEKGFNDYSKRALNDGLKSFVEVNLKSFVEVNHQPRYKIVEIGPGDGSKTRLILNTIGAENIQEYHLIDVNDVFLDIAEKILEDTRKDHEFKYKKHLLDICDSTKISSYKYLDDGNEEKRIDDIFHESVVIIATNSSLFCENDFKLDVFSGCKTILLTIQVLSGEEKKEDSIKKKYSLYQRLNLLIHPLNAFNIPIKNTIAKDYLKVIYQNDKLKINFRLKDYILELKKQKGIEMNFKEPKDLSCYTKEYKKDYDSYKTLLNKFVSSEEITIYETLKFEEKCDGETECKDGCKQNCNIHKCPYFDKFRVQFGLTKDHKGISKYAFVLLQKKDTNDKD